MCAAYSVRLPAVRPPAVRLPARVALAAHHDVHVRAADSRQIGLDPSRGLVLEDLPPAVAGALDELGPTGVRTDELVRRATADGADGTDGAEPDEVRDVLCTLVGSGLLRDADRAELVSRRRAGSAVEVRGDGALALGVASGLADAGVGRVYGSVTGRGPVGRAAPDLVVLTDARAWPPHETLALVRRALTHLVLGLRDGHGLVGPLVLPGRSACLGCLDLVRTGLDPGWPALAAAQLGRDGTADRPVVDATVALGVAQAVLALDGPVVGGIPPPTLNTTVEIDVARCALPVRRWSPHPGCPCGAASAVRSGPPDAPCATPTRRGTIRE